MSEKIKVLIADDHPIFRKGLSQVIEAAGDMEVTGEAENGVIALELLTKNPLDIIIADVDMPIMDGIELARKMLQMDKRTPIVFLTMHKDRQILDSLGPLRVSGYVLKDSAIAEIALGIRTVLGGGIYLSPALSELLVERPMQSESRKSGGLLQQLTPTELNVLKLITTSKTNREIADEMFVSVRTVENHRFNICRKLGVRGNHGLFKFAISNKDEILTS